MSESESESTRRDLIHSFIFSDSRIQPFCFSSLLLFQFQSLHRISSICKLAMDYEPYDSSGNLSLSLSLSLYSLSLSSPFRFRVRVSPSLFFFNLPQLLPFHFFPNRNSYGQNNRSSGAATSYGIDSSDDFCFCLVFLD